MSDRNRIRRRLGLPPLPSRAFVRAAFLLAVLALLAQLEVSATCAGLVA